MAARRLPLPTRARAWAYTGPLGHLYGGVADLCALLGRLALAKARGRAGTG
jgi:hypothetical protein